MDRILFYVVVLVVLLVYLAIYCLALYPSYKIFQKAGENGYKAFIPFYNTFLIGKIARDEKLGYILLALNCISLVIGVINLIAFSYVINFIVMCIGCIVGVIVFINLADRFKRDNTFKRIYYIVYAIMCVSCLIVVFVGERNQMEAIDSSNLVFIVMLCCIAIIWFMLLNLATNKKYPTYYKYEKS